MFCLKCTQDNREHEADEKMTRMCETRRGGIKTTMSPLYNKKYIKYSRDIMHVIITRIWKEDIVTAFRTALNQSGTSGAAIISPNGYMARK